MLGVPIFLWLMLGPHHDVAAVIVLAVGGSSDWIDGWVARRLGQVSRLGELLDPLADRLYILATLVAFTCREIVPWEFTAALVARELMMVVCLGRAAPQRLRPAAGALPRQDRHLHPARRVPGAAAGARRRRPIATGAAAVGWGLAWWGIVLYWIAGFLYVGQAPRVIRAGRGAAA